MKIRVGIRGISGVLGCRLAEVLHRQPDIDLVAGTARVDSQRLPQLLTRLRILREREAAPPYLLLIEGDSLPAAELAKLADINWRFSKPHPLHELCDVVVDTTAAGVSARFQDRDGTSGVPVLLQSGDYPRGRLLSFPFVEPGSGLVFRQGDCLTSCAVPVLRALPDAGLHLTRLAVDVVMQVPLSGSYLTGDLAGHTFISPGLARRLCAELRLCANAEVVVHPVRMIQGLAHYTVRFNLEFDRPVGHRDLTKALRGGAGMWLAPPGIRSTHEVQYCAREPNGGAELPSVVLLEELLVPGPGERATREVEIHAAVAYQQVTAKANLDSIRFLA